MGWGFVAQTFSSTANFGLTVVAGRSLGPSGLGVVSIGFFASLLVVALQRALVSQPLVARSAALNERSRRKATARALTTSAALALVAAVGLLLAALLSGGLVRRGLLLFTPWILPIALQDIAKVILFQEGRGRAGASVDFVRAVAVLCVALAPGSVRSDVAVVSGWGVGSCLACVLAFTVIQIRPASPIDAWSWLRNEAWALGRWLAAREVVVQGLGYATIVALVSIIGGAGVGGLRAAESLFSPFSFVASAIALPGLPALSRAVARSRRAGLSLAARLSGVAVAATLLYLAVMIVAGPWLLSHVFGAAFGRYDALVRPLGVWQVVDASFFTFGLLLTAQSRGKQLFVANLCGSAVSFACVTSLAAATGVVGAGWGYVIGSFVAVSIATTFALRSPRGENSE
jgi:O-antigen/teichoic acid export membrane protein